MKTKQLLACAIVAAGLVSLWACNNAPKTETVKTEPQKVNDWYGFGSDTLYGEHLVAILDCAICHTPKKMTELGPVPDETRAFSGRPTDMPLPPIDRALAEKYGKEGVTIIGVSIDQIDSSALQAFSGESQVIYFEKGLSS